MKGSGDARVIWPTDFDERAKFELPFKGWLSVCIELNKGQRYPLHFSDPIRLQQELDERARLGKPYLAVPGLIILPEVTVEAIEATVLTLCRQDFFDHLQIDHNGERVAALEPQPA